MITYSQALEKISSCQLPHGSVSLNLEDCLGRVLARDFFANVPSPPFTNSAMDGFAVVRSEAVGQLLKIVGTIYAKPEISVGRHHAGECVRIMTGAPIPEWADTVIPVELAQVNSDCVEFPLLPETGSHIRKIGADLAQGQLLLSADTCINPEHLMVAASSGYTSLDVKSLPEIAVFTTGDELVMPGEPLQPGTIYNSSHFFLKGALKKIGLIPSIIRTLTDDELQASREISKFLGKPIPKIIITTGAVSAGEKDFIPELARNLGFEVIFHQVAVRPGKPIFLARRDDCFWIGLAGNAISTSVGFHFFLKPLLQATAGIFSSPSFSGVLAETISKPEKLRCFYRARSVDGLIHISSAQGSSHLKASAESNCYVELPEGSTQIMAGTPVKVTAL
jgi:molybdopterin molybdotransferase